MAWAQSKMNNADTGRIHLTLCSHTDKTAFNLLYRRSVFYLLIKRRKICVNKMLNWVLYMFIVGLSLLCLGSFSTFPGNRWRVPLQCQIACQPAGHCGLMWRHVDWIRPVLHDSLVLEHLETLVLLQKSQRPDSKVYSFYWKLITSLIRQSVPLVWGQRCCFPL